MNTEAHKKYWKERKIDWKQSYLYGVDPVSNKPMWDHPHRDLIMSVLNSFRWTSLWEVGCGAGANLMKIISVFKDKQLAGSDINEQAIEVARETFKGGIFRTDSTDNLIVSDDATDVVLSDAHLIYFGPDKIDRALDEMVRVCRNNLVLCEFHSKSFFKRWWLRITRGYNAYDYKKLLEKRGCYDIRIGKIPKTMWPGDPWESFGYIISAKIGKRK